MKSCKEIKAAGGSRGCTAVRSTQHGHATPATGRGENHEQPVVICGPVVPLFPERRVLVLLFGP